MFRSDLPMPAAESDLGAAATRGLPRGGTGPRSRIGRVAALAVIGLTVASCGVATRASARATPTHPAPTKPAPSLPAAESGVLPWSLAAPLSREVLLPGPGSGQLTILGGLAAGGSSAAGVYTLNTASGALTYSGSLTGPLHDASGAVVGGREMVFGGGTVASSAAVQTLPGTLGAASLSGTLPQARSDSASAVVGGTAYIVGGYDGASFDPTVLATTNGTSFTAVAKLPIPVRYPAVAALGGSIYVFGGQTADGEPTASVQLIDPATHTARVVGALPEPVTGASAATLQGVMYVMGGRVPLRDAAPRVPGSA